MVRGTKPAHRNDKKYWKFQRQTLKSPYFPNSFCSEEHENIFLNRNKKIALRYFEGVLYRQNNPKGLSRIIQKVQGGLNKFVSASEADSIIKKTIHRRYKKGNDYFKKEYYPFAIKHFEATLHIMQVINNYYNIDILELKAKIVECSLQNDFQSAFQKKDYAKSMNLLSILELNALGDSLKLSSYKTKMGKVYKAQGKLDEALEAYQAAIKLANPSIPQKNRHNWLEVAKIEIELKNYEKAINCLDKAKKGNLEQKELNTINLKIGDCYQLLEQYETAIKAYLTINNLHCSTKDFRSNTELNSRIGYAYLMLKNYDLAEKYFNQSSYFLTDNLDKIKFYYTTRDYKKSLEECQKRLSNFDYHLSPDCCDIYTNPPADIQRLDTRLIEVLHFKAKNLYAYYKNETGDLKDLRFSIETYNLIDTLRHWERKKTPHSEGKKINVQKGKDIYEESLKAAIEYYTLTQDTSILEIIFKWMDNSKGILLLEGIQDDKFKTIAGIPKRLLEKEKILNDKMSQIAGLITRIDNYLADKPFLFNTEKHKHKNTLWWELEKLKEEYETYIEDIKKQYPKYATLEHWNNSITITAIQQQLSDSTAFLNYFVGEKQVYLLSITSKNIDVKIIEKGEDFEANIKRFMQQVKNKPKNSNLNIHYNQLIKDAQYLYQKLLAPISSQLKDANHWIISPDDMLSVLPFGVLMSDALTIPAAKNIGGVNYQQLPYLQKNYNIQYTYSAAMLFQQNNHQKKRKNDLLAFAPFAPDNIHIAPSGTINSLRNKDFNLLPGSLKEVQNIAKNTQLKGLYYYGAKASEEQFKQNLKSSQIIHLSTHGDVNLKNEDASKLIFSGSLHRDDDSLFTHEIYNLDLNTDLVVLSACQTGKGKYVKGEGVFSLARAFMYAGSPSVAMTLWKVADRESAALMGHFYQHLEEKLPKSKALQLAKTDYLNSTLGINDYTLSAHPFYWAAFVLIGDDGALFLE